MALAFRRRTTRDTFGVGPKDGSGQVEPAPTPESVPLPCFLRARNFVHNITDGFDCLDAVAYRTRTAFIAERRQVNAFRRQQLGIPDAVVDAEDEACMLTEAEHRTSAAIADYYAAHDHLSATTYFTLFIVLCIALNTVVLASQYHQQPAWLTQVQKISNIVFTSIFCVEMTHAALWPRLVLLLLRPLQRD